MDGSDQHSSSPHGWPVPTHHANDRRMHGPKPAGHWTTSVKAAPFKHLKPGARCVVSAAFRDYDGDLHAMGESWVFLGHSFLPHDDGLSLLVSLDHLSEWHIRLQWRPEEQANIIDNLDSYIRCAEA